MKKRPKPKIKHLWFVRVKHRDYLATINSTNGWGTYKEPRTETTLYLLVPGFSDKPDAEASIRKARQFCDRHQRYYKNYVIQSTDYQGTIDE